MSIQDYYAELQKGMICAGVPEGAEDKICHFYSRLCTKIHDIIDNKEYNIVNHLFQPAMLVKKEVQCRQLLKMETSFMPRPATTTPLRTAMPSRAHSSMTTSTSHGPSTSSTPSATAPRATDPSKAFVLQGATIVKPSSSTVSTGRTSDIKCHHCHGIGHLQRDCPSKKSYIAIPDKGYVSASDTEDDFALQTNHASDLADDDDDA
jgi:hypothetical protein